MAEADRMLSDLAKGGHLEVRVEGGKLLYSLQAGEGIPSSSAELRGNPLEAKFAELSF